MCFKAFHSNGSLRGHFLSHSDIDRINCEICNAITYPGSFVKHSCTRLSEYEDFILRDGRFHCPKCTEICDTKDDYIEHRNIHIQEKYFVCDICKKVFYKKRIFRKHMDLHLSKFRL